jgi:hypothetical protein
MPGLAKFNAAYRAHRLVGRYGAAAQGLAGVAAGGKLPDLELVLEREGRR